MRLFYIIAFLFIATSIQGQTLEGVVVDEMTGKPLFAAGVTNLNTQISTYTNQDGHFRLPAKISDSVRFSFVGYKAVVNIVPAAALLSQMKVPLAPDNFMLDEFTIHPNYTPYQIDSMKRHAEFAKDLDKQPVKVKFGTTGQGIGVDGVIGSLVQKVSRGEKKRKKFAKEFKQEEEERYIDLKYTPEIVSSLTGFKDDSLATFMNTYPMEYQFARTASDLEIKMWVRYNYRNYMKIDSLKAASVTR